MPAQNPSTSRVGASAARWAALAAIGVALLCTTARADVTDPNFVEETLHSGTGTISIVFGPDGRLYLAEKVGRVLVFQPDGAGGYQPPTPAVDISSMVAPAGESGLLGMALDPAFATNRHMFLFFTTPTDQRLVRIQLDSSLNQMVANSMQVVLAGFPRAADFHKAGDIHFDPSDDNAILIALGDDGDRDAPQNLTRYEGKILRIHKATGLGLADNPFYESNGSSIRSRVWAYGLRNPFRFTFHPALPDPNVIYVSENGDSTDRISRVTRGSNGAWNAQGDSGGFLNPPDTNHRVLLPRPNAAVVGIAIARGGPFVDPAHPNDDVLLVAEAGGGGVLRRYRLFGAALDQATEVASDPPGGFSDRDGHGYAFGAHIAFGPDGALYMSQSGGGASPGTYYGLRRIRHVSGSAPRAAFSTTPDPARGNAPLSVRFTDASTDPDGTVTSYRWTFGDGATSTERSPTRTYTTPGTFTATLTVTDDSGLQGTAQTPITVTDSRSLHLIVHVLDARTNAPVPLAVATELRLYEADGTTPLTLNGGTNAIAIPAGGELDTTIDVELTDSYVVATAGEPMGDGVHHAARGFAVTAGAQGETHTLTFHLSSTAVRGRVTDSRGNPVAVDVGIARGSSTAPYAIANGRDLLQSPMTGVVHRVVADVTGRFYFPIREGDGGATFHFDTTRDTGTETYTQVRASAMIEEGDLHEQPLTIGLWSGGNNCDDLSSIAVTPNVDYTTQIQPIWEGSCIGCHAPGATNTGGLELNGNSLTQLLGVESRHVAGLMMIEPGHPDRSYLMEKINCASPQQGTRMRPTDAMPPTQQALIRDFIAQLAASPATDAGSRDASRQDGSTGVSGSGAAPSKKKSSGCNALPMPSSSHPWTTAAFFGAAALALVQRQRMKRQAHTSPD